ncbi:TetR/AcrR family transcriptional regulator [Streptomyces oceani]|uniref:HTH tetR-type domain-containing protein n=1 Tax=Streptomyces oceani TaxID=1075402 RepID=A0A1E7KFA9_9ACTN|nr:TetR/AcrR family transcriptional regulator [Streptomyces oceani]OEV02585.1 hypothetical protein AN216_13740 [Streptomyces oceani]
MANSGGHPKVSPRGQRRREQLVEAGVELLAEGGWPAVTTRAVADRAGANQGLLHYHWGGLPRFREAVVQRAASAVFGAFADQLVASHSVEDALARLPGLLQLPEGDLVGRLSVELLAGAARDPELGALIKDYLARARTETADWLARHRPDDPPGTGTLLIALLDGLYLHSLLDPEVSVGQALEALNALVLGQKATPVSPDPATAREADPEG